MISQAQAAFQEALEHLKDLEAKHKGTDIELNSLRLQAKCNLFQQKWEPAVEAYGRILSRSAALNKLNMKQAEFLIKTINTLSGTQVKDYGVPVRIYKKFISENPQHGLNPVILKLIRSFELMQADKSQNNKPTQPQPAQ